MGNCLFLRRGGPPSSGPDIFGVVWDYANSSLSLTRLTAASDPNGYVTVDITEEPSPAVSTGAGSSPFDNFMPWAGMEEYNIINSAVAYKQGDAGFSRSDYDTMVYIPEFYYAVLDDAAGSKRYFYVADRAGEGFERHPGSGRYVGKYNTTAGYYSKTGAAPLGGIGRATARTNSVAKGAGWYLYDYMSWCAVWLLYLVEFANWDSQSRIGLGSCKGFSTALNNGTTDTMNYHTGTIETSLSLQGGIQYRHIENPWGNVCDWIDGINFVSYISYICIDPDKYTDGSSEDYFSTNIAISSGWTKSLGISADFQWAFLPNEGGGSETTYIPDLVSRSTSRCALNVGGGYKMNGIYYAGLFCIDASFAASANYGYYGTRLLFIPQ